MVLGELGRGEIERLQRVTRGLERVYRDRLRRRLRLRNRRRSLLLCLRLAGLVSVPGVVHAASTSHSPRLHHPELPESTQQPCCTVLHSSLMGQNARSADEMGTSYALGSLCREIRDLFRGLRRRRRAQQPQTERAAAGQQQAAGYFRLTCGHLTLSSRRIRAHSPPYQRSVCHYTPWYRSAIRRHRQDAASVVEFQAMSDVVRLEYRDVTMRFVAASGKALTAVQGVSLAVRDGEVVSLIGPSGCGKSTLLNIGSGLYTPSEGEAFVDGERVEGPNAHVAFMLQKDLLLPWRTVIENVMFGVEIQRLALPERRRRAHALLENFNLAEFAGHYPHQLSGGMRQRVALARTLAVDPSVLLLDEPFSAVDAQTRMVLQRELAQTLKHAGKTALLITHDLLEAVTLSDRVLVMSRRPGRVIDEIRIELPQREDPIRRRQDGRVAIYMARLMERLEIARPEGARAALLSA